MARQVYAQLGLQGYYVWLEAVDAIIDGRIGCSVLDLADQPYRDWYDAGVSPARAAGRAIRSESE